LSYWRNLETLYMCLFFMLIEPPLKFSYVIERHDNDWSRRWLTASHSAY